MTATDPRPGLAAMPAAKAGPGRRGSPLPARCCMHASRAGLWNPGPGSTPAPRSSSRHGRTCSTAVRFSDGAVPNGRLPGFSGA